MGCCTPRTSSFTRRINRREDMVLQIPGASVYLMEDADAPVELAKGDFTVLRITEDDMVLATAVRVGPDLRWPLAKDEPVIKLDQLHYLFTLPCKDGGGFLNYGVSFAAPHASLASLDMFLKENACFSTPSNTSSSSLKTASAYEASWKDYSPRIEDYNGVLAKAIAGGTGEIVKGIFMCSNAYTSQVQRGAALLQPQAAANNIYASAKRDNHYEVTNSKKRGEINKNIRRVRKLSEMTEKMSRSLLDGVVLVTSSAAAPLVRSKAGKSFLAMFPGEVLLASLDAINKVLDAAEVAERNTLAATSNVVSGAVSKRFGESAGEATEDAFATAGHAVGTAWNLFKIRKAITPSSSLQSSIVKNAVRKKR